MIVAFDLRSTLPEGSTLAARSTLREIIFPYFITYQHVVSLPVLSLSRLLLRF